MSDICLSQREHTIDNFKTYQNTFPGDPRFGYKMLLSNEQVVEHFGLEGTTEKEIDDLCRHFLFRSIPPKFRTDHMIDTSIEKDQHTIDCIDPKRLTYERCYKALSTGYTDIVVRKTPD